MTLVLRPHSKSPGLWILQIHIPLAWTLARVVVINEHHNNDSISSSSIITRRKQWRHPPSRMLLPVRPSLHRPLRPSRAQLLQLLPSLSSATLPSPAKYPIPLLLLLLCCNNHRHQCMLHQSHMDMDKDKDMDIVMDSITRHPLLLRREEFRMFILTRLINSLRSSIHS